MRIFDVKDVKIDMLLENGIDAIYLPCPRFDKGKFCIGEESPSIDELMKSYPLIYHKLSKKARIASVRETHNNVFESVNFNFIPHDSISIGLYQTRERPQDTFDIDLAVQSLNRIHQYIAQYPHKIIAVYLPIFQEKYKIVRQRKVYYRFITKVIAFPQDECVLYQA